MAKGRETCRPEAYFKLNTVSGGVGQADGIVRYWYDGQLVIDHSNVILRTGQYPTMKFNQFLVALYIGDGSPVDQTVWIDQLTIATARPTTSPDAAPPKLDAAAPKKDGAPPKKDSAPLGDGAIVKDTSGDAAQLQDSAAPLRDSASGEGKARLSGGCGDCGVSGLPDGDCHDGVALLIAGILWACRSRRGRTSA